MVDFIQLQDIMREQLTMDRTIKTVTVTGPTLDEAVAEASTLLNIPVRRLEYEITERGSPGIFGTGKKDWVINAYERQIVKIETEDTEDFFHHESHKEIVHDTDGDAFVHLSKEGVFLKVIPPKGRGKKIHEPDVKRLIFNRHVNEVNDDLVSKIVREAKSEYTKIGDFPRNPSHDSMLVIDFSEGEMKAFITVSPPGMGG